MKKRKKYKISSLIYLYLDYIFQKTTLIIFIVSLILIAMILCLVANSSYNESYINTYKEIHILFNNQSLLFIQIFNSVLVGAFVIQLGIMSESFDILFVSYVPRIIICIAKIAALSIVLFFISIFEVLMILIIGSLNFNLYTVSGYDILGILYIFISLLFECLISLSITCILSNIYIPLLILFLFIIIKISINNSIKIYEMLTSILPFIGYDRTILGISSCKLYIGIMWNILLGLTYNGLYNIKNLK